MAEPRVLPALPSSAERCGVPYRRRRWAAGETARVHRRRTETSVTDLASIARERAMRSRRSQGLPDHITDPAVFDFVARLVVLATPTDEVPHAGVPP
jgi:hypothetical protein